MTTLRMSLLERELYDPINETDEHTASRLFVGNLHIAQGDIRSGFDESDTRAAIGHIPVLIRGRSIQKYFFSLPFAMYVVGEVMKEDDTGYCDFYTDFAEGICMFTADKFTERIEMKTGRTMRDLGTQLYYNFPTGKSVAEFTDTFMWLSSVSRRFETGMGIDAYISRPCVKGTKNGKVQYFFIASTEMPEFLLRDDERNDIISTPASGTNQFPTKNRAFSASRVT
jgi:hypothetical protein